MSQDLRHQGRRVGKKLQLELETCPVPPKFAVRLGPVSAVARLGLK